MSLDFPRAWQIARAAPLEQHHPECSYIVTDGALLCDLACPVIADSSEFQCEALHGADGVVCKMSPPGPACPGHRC